MRTSIGQVLTWGICSFVHSGADVGGFFGSPDANLLARWYQVGAWLYPFFRCHCHHLSAHRELYVLKGDYFSIAREAVVDRYRLLPYWYTLARHANLTGEPIVRPLWWEFPDDKYIDVDDRAMVGSAIFVVPFLSHGSDPMTIALPVNSRWFFYRTLAEVNGTEVRVDFDGGRTPVFVRGGSIIPIKKRIRKSSALMFWDPFSLIVALDASGHAEGQLFVDDGESYDYALGGFVHRKFVMDGVKLSSVAAGGKSEGPFVGKYDVVVEQIQIAGMAKPPKKIVDKGGKELRFGEKDGLVTIHRPQLPLREDFQLTFQY
jgi:alpha 1,3-glucosidase